MSSMFILPLPIYLIIMSTLSDIEGARVLMQSCTTAMILQILVPIWYLDIPVGFLISFYGKYLYHLCCKKAIIHRQYEVLCSRRATCPTSNRISMPSGTYFEPSHTGAFTTIEELHQTNF